jgi:hypothetical protein
VNTFLGTDGSKLSMLDDGSGAIASYVVYNSSGRPVRLLVYNSDYYTGSGTRSSASVSFTGGGLSSSGSKTATRLTAPNATSRVDQGAAVTIGSGLSVSKHRDLWQFTLIRVHSSTEIAMLSGRSQRRLCRTLVAHCQLQ